MKLPAMNLNSRGLIVVAFPLLCQLFFLILLGFRLNEVQSFMLSEASSQNIIRQAYTLSNETINKIIADWTAFEYGGPQASDHDNQWHPLTHKVNVFLQLIENDPLQAPAIKGFQQALLEMTAGLNDAERQLKSANWKQKGRELQEYLIEAAPRWNNALNRIIAIEEGKVTADTEAIQRSTGMLVTLVGLFAAINIIVALFLGVYFVVMISTPLEHIRKNGKRLSNRERLLPTLTGAAEFTTLDNLLHSASESLESALHQNRELVENAADIIVSSDQTGKIVSINSYSKKLLGFDSEDLIDQPMHILAVPEQSFLAEENFRAVMQSQKSEVFELRLRTADGGQVESRWSCLWSEPHKRMFSVIHDVTEQKRIEQMKEDFANMISHDLRSPLMAMHNSLTLVLMGAKGQISEQIKSDVTKTVANLDRLMLLVNDLLDFQKLKAGRMELQKENFDFNQVADETADMLSSFAEERQLKIVCPAEHCSLFGDKQKISQVLTNLVSNAIKFSPAGEEIRIDCKSTNEGVQFSVSDQGRGIPQENRSRVFETFEQSQHADSKEGTGLGLAICRLIVEAHGGKIWVETGENDKGSRFIALLPATELPDTKL